MIPQPQQLNRIPMAHAVTIDGRSYRVLRLTHSHSRGYEYYLRCEEKGINNIRVCHAPTHKVGSVKTSGEKIIYHWDKPAS